MAAVVLRTVGTVLSLASIALAYKDDSYYPNGITNPNVKHAMYWHDASNVLQDLDQFSELHVQFHSCAWSPFVYEATDPNEDDNMDETDYWYMNAMPKYGPNIAFSLYGSLAGHSFSGCNKKTYINSFYTTTGFPVFASTLQTAGISNTGTKYGVNCDNSIGLQCYDNTGSSTFVMMQYNGECKPENAQSASVPTDLASFNDVLKNDAQCAQIYSSTDGTVPELLQYSRVCSLGDFVGACPNPYGIKGKYDREIMKLAVTDSYYHKQIMQGSILFAVGGVLWIGAYVLYLFAVKHYPLPPGFKYVKNLKTKAKRAKSPKAKKEKKAKKEEKVKKSGLLKKAKAAGAKAAASVKGSKKTKTYAEKQAELAKKALTLTDDETVNDSYKSLEDSPTTPAVFISKKEAPKTVPPENVFLAPLPDDGGRKPTAQSTPPKAQTTPIKAQATPPKVQGTPPLAPGNAKAAPKLDPPKTILRSPSFASARNNIEVQAQESSEEDDVDLDNEWGSKPKTPPRTPSLPSTLPKSHIEKEGTKSSGSVLSGLSSWINDAFDTSPKSDGEKAPPPSQAAAGNSIEILLPPTAVVETTDGDSSGPETSKAKKVRRFRALRRKLAK